jgi:peptidoglycan/LPS O-acetylase OafA/YrhL
VILQALLLGVLLALALLSRRVRAYAVALAFSVVVTMGAEIAQDFLTPPSDDPVLFYKIPSYADAFVFSAIAVLMVSERLKWWTVALCGIAFATATYGAWFWWAYYLGVSVDPYYVPVFQGLFLISVAILVFAGGNDVFERVGSFLASLRDVLVRPSRLGWARPVHRKAVLEKRA